MIRYPFGDYGIWVNFWKWIAYACWHPEDEEARFMARTLGEALEL